MIAEAGLFKRTDFILDSQEDFLSMKAASTKAQDAAKDYLLLVAGPFSDTQFSPTAYADMLQTGRFGCTAAPVIWCIRFPVHVSPQITGHRKRDRIMRMYAANSSGCPWRPEIL